MGVAKFWTQLRDFTFAQSRARLRDFTFTFHFHALEKEMATHSSVLAWRTLENPVDTGHSRTLENPREGGAWWAAIYGVAQSQT